MKEEELLEQLNNAFYNSNLWLKQEGILEKFIEKKKQSLEEIVALIKKPQVTEEWILEWERRLTHYAMGLTYKEANREIRTMLKEIGVSVA